MSFETFAFLAVMFGVILSLGIAALLSAAGSMLKSRAEARPYWVYVAWVLLQLVLYLHIWWSFWNLQRVVAEWTFFNFLFLLMGPTALFLATQVSLPDSTTTEDSEAHYYRVHRVFFSLVAIVVAWELAAVALFFHETDPLLGLQIVALVVLATLAYSENRSLHAGLTLASWGLFLVGVAGYGLRLGSA